MSFRVLDARDLDHRAAWTALWERWPGREVQAHPAYGLLFARPGDRVLALTFEAGGTGGVIYPVIVRPLAGEPWAGPDESAWDLVTPYGYGGPFAWGAARDDAREVFWDAVDGWAATARVVTSFARLSLFPDQLLPWRGAVEEKMPNVVRGLGLEPDALWMDYAHKVRKNVKRARRAGLEVEIDPDGDRLEAFLEIYHATMDRRGAAEGFYFPRAFFETIVRDLPGQHVFVHVLAGERVVSTELVLVSAHHAYSFLGGTLPEAFPDRANDLLKHAVHEWAGGAGLDAFVLGGGYGGPDGIFKYKLSFAPSGEVPFCVGARVHDPAEVQRLVDARRAHERAAGVDWAPRAGWFPPYRA